MEYLVKFKYVDGGLEGEISVDRKSKFKRHEALRIAQEMNKDPATADLYVHFIKEVA